ncbi:FKBP-type peptidyl-prolyl cis-trans isomerase [Sulfurospirillum deleyianum]|uniref:Peptidyl-prolyl cis-trans isomerase n=1 Tax=Sulfurospirillum deleyianum (strain ATCC 51133 / DSM 6946 / 5175) TaxID=525898 RepID=D1B0W7_SULD5|nr:FKBP-type peptidyl-prolyl cis-trans isomerase [Sulfurospirillum deleyianum]ACZ11737.1 FKBP-type peptidyl-prolyl isomerase domain protein [Sulfurospirillum deleyianum DSM 6946]
MSGKKISIGLFLFLCLATEGFTVELKTDVQKESYSMGVSTGAYIANQLFEQSEFGVKADMEAVIEGFMDALKKKQKLSDEEVITHLNNRAEGLNKISQERFKQQLNTNLDAGKKYLATNAKNKHVITTKSGLQYEKITEGKGEKPKPESIVLIHYKGSLLDGTVFDNTYERKQPAHLSMINVVDGLQEGLMLMHEGEKAKLVIPSELAYGNADVQAIPAGSTVIFEVELVKVLKPGALNNSAKPLSEEAKKEALETHQPLKKL